jgi:hypothetical protein
MLVSCNAFLKWGIRIPLRLLAIPHKKKRLVTRIKGRR